MLPRTEHFLSKNPEIWDDGGFAFECGPNRSTSTEADAVLAYFGATTVVSARSGAWNHQVLVTDSAIREVELEAGRRALVQLLAHDLRMFSYRQVQRDVLEELTDVFFSEMGQSKVFSNTMIYPAGQKADCLGPWSPVTKHSKDTFICVVNAECIAYWLYGDDE